MDTVDLNSKELAALCGASPSYISRVAGGKCSPGPELRKAMATALRVSVDELFMRIHKAPGRQPGDRKQAEWKPRRQPTPVRVRTDARKRGRKRRRVARDLAYPEVPEAVE